jgi:hypothetical protein
VHATDDPIDPPMRRPEDRAMNMRHEAAPRRRGLRRLAALAALVGGALPAATVAARAAKLAAAAVLVAAAPARAAPGHAWLPESRRVGEASLRMLGLHIYDASLYALPSFEAQRFAAHPLVLELEYRRSFSGEAIAERSLKEMRRGGPIDDGSAERWLRFMRGAFPDVRPGDRLAGLWLPERQTSRFAANAGATHELIDVDFGPRFFGIWLAAHTSLPDLRGQLLGRRA